MHNGREMIGKCGVGLRGAKVILYVVINEESWEKVRKFKVDERVELDRPHAARGGNRKQKYARQNRERSREKRSRSKLVVE